MPLTAMQKIDWDKIWDDQMQLTSLKGDGVEFWNKSAARINSISFPQDDYTQELMRRMVLSPKMTVLDVGCGPGGLSLPLAERTCSVTALDLSPVMLQHLQQKIAEGSIANIRTVNADFVNQDLTGLDTYDIVLASRSLPMGNLRAAITKMDSLCKQCCYLTWIARSKEIDIKLCQILGKEYHPYPDYIIIANILYTMGIYANIEIFTATSEQRYADPDEAVDLSLRGQEADNEKREQIKDFIKKNTVIKDGARHIKQYYQWALIWWQKR